MPLTEELSLVFVRKLSDFSISLRLFSRAVSCAVRTSLVAGGMMEPTGGATASWGVAGGAKTPLEADVGGPKTLLDGAVVPELLDAGAPKILPPAEAGVPKSPPLDVGAPNGAGAGVPKRPLVEAGVGEPKPPNALEAGAMKHRSKN